MHVLIYRRISRRCANVIYGFSWMLGVISSGIRVTIDATLTSRRFATLCSNQ